MLYQWDQRSETITDYIFLGGKLVTESQVSLGDGSQSVDNTNVGYTGHQWDQDTGLNYMQARYYDPLLGRFYSNDPIGFTNLHTFNRYGYANNNPYKFKDPDGNNPKLIADFVFNVAINYLTTGSPGLALAARETLEGAFNPLKTLKNADKLYKLLKKQGTIGSYTIKFGNGKLYHGKGPLKRMEGSMKKKMKDNGGVANAKWDEATDNASAFKDEAKKIRAAKGVKNPNNLNEINSPGEKLLQAEEASSGAVTKAANKQESQWLD